jgi:flagellar assembly protein FliH
MSEHWNPISLGRGASITAMPPIDNFRSWASRLDPDVPLFEDFDEVGSPPPAGIDADAIALDAFAQGYAEGRHVAGVEFAGECQAIDRLAAAIEALRPEPPAALATLIAETVERLVRQIVGGAPVDQELLLARAEAAAALVADETGPVRMRLHPEDRVRLADAEIGLELIADSMLTPGSIVIETRDGWIEDGPDAALDRLRAQLDRMGVPR